MVISSTRFYMGEKLPRLKDVDFLVVLGGPMSVNDNALYSWLTEEIEFVYSAVASHKRVFGICLGAQILAKVLGSRIYENPYKEIGWFPVRKSDAVEQTILKGILPDEFVPFHWHGETFDLPKGSVLLGRSEATLNQGFIFENRVFAFQFHLELTPKRAKDLLTNSRSELNDSPYVQSPKEILGNPDRFSIANSLMFRILDRIISE